MGHVIIIAVGESLVEDAGIVSLHYCHYEADRQVLGHVVENIQIVKSIIVNPSKVSINLPLTQNSTQLYCRNKRFTMVSLSHEK